MNYEYTKLKELIDDIIDKINKRLEIPEISEKNPITNEAKIQESFRDIEIMICAIVRKLDDIVTVLKKNKIDVSEIFNL